MEKFHIEKFSISTIWRIWFESKFNIKKLPTLVTGCFVFSVTALIQKRRLYLKYWIVIKVTKRKRKSFQRIIYMTLCNFVKFYYWVESLYVKRNLIPSLKESSRPEAFCKKSFLRNFTKFTGKHLCQSLFFNKVAGLRLANLLTKRAWYRCFAEDFAIFLRTTFFIEHLVSFWNNVLVFLWKDNYGKNMTSERFSSSAFVNNLGYS